ncbi:MAG: hypothetical protein ACKVJG_11960 [Candidatus Latescibacterota bacterium]|jgi:uncharacterized protein YijF (DUF1287 family)
MMEKIPRLPDAHLDNARALIAENRNKKNCKVCYDRGFVGTNQDNMLVPCGKCVDSDAVMKAWRGYVRDNEELSALYGDYFEEGEGEAGEEGGEEEKGEAAGEEKEK